jgi:hypothetical protein
MPNLRIVTCVTNAGGVGPGHTALWVDNQIYSFELMGHANGWLVQNASTYLNNEGNSNRPVIAQTLNGNVNAQTVLNSLRAEAAEWFEQYSATNVCSMRASANLDTGASNGFNPSGVDTPYGVYWHAWNKHYVGSERCVWQIRGSNFQSKREKLLADYQFDLDSVDTHW